jgi:glycosyltransferase involved in cell wall biosynthesis
MDIEVSPISVRPRILYRLEAVGGGIYTYSVHQIGALVRAGAAVTVLCREGTKPSDFPGALVKPELQEAAAGLRLRRPLAYIRDARFTMKRLTFEASKGYDFVLLDCFREYFAPLWIGPLRSLREAGLPIGIINHDPSRDFKVGPVIWHRRCLWAVYAAVTDIFVHGAVSMTACEARFRNRVHTLPHGPLTSAAGFPERASERRARGFAEKDFVILCFGQIRDGKQLDKLIRALRGAPGQVKLLVAGRVESHSQRGLPYYKQLIQFCGLADRVVWDYRYIPDDEVGRLFACSDAVATLYSERFVSSSGVMSCAVAHRRPLLISCGEGPMKTAVMRYPIGEWVRPGDPAALGVAIAKLVTGAKDYSFEAYLKDHSWEENARQVLSVVKATMRSGEQNCLIGLEFGG